MFSADEPPISNHDLDLVVAHWRNALGESFHSAGPGQTLRTSATVIQKVAPDAELQITLVPRIGSLARPGEFRLHEIVGEGGMGQIFRADQGSLCRDVAIKKIIPGHLGRDSAQETQESFVAEAMVTGFLEHPNIVPVHSLGQDESGSWFFAMKMVRGIAWKYLLHPDQCDGDEACGEAHPKNLHIDDPKLRAEHLEENLKILQAVCNAVAFAHSKNIIHRDLKPENIMVGAFGEVLVMDWGLAIDVAETLNSAEARAPHKSAAGLGGTAEYMAPEQTFSDGRGLSTQTDVFMLGAMLHELLTGKAPNAADNIQLAIMKACQCDAPREFGKVLPELAEICRKALSKKPQKRYETALEFQKALNEFVKHRQSAQTASKAAKEAQRNDIRALSRSVILYDQALDLWPGNKTAANAAQKVRAALTAKEYAASRTRFAARALAATVILGLSIGFLWIRAERNATEAQRSIAVANKNEAITQKNIAVANEGHATAQKKIADSKSIELSEALIVSGKRGDLLMTALDREVFAIQEELDKRPGLQNVKKKLLTDAIVGMKQAAEFLRNAKGMERQAAIAHQKIADVYLETGAAAEALNEYGVSRSIFEGLVAAKSSDTAAKFDLAICEKKMGSAQFVLGDAKAGYVSNEASLNRLEQLVSAEPENLEYQKSLSIAHIVFGDVLCINMGDASRGHDQYQKALIIAQRLVNAAPKDMSLQINLADAQYKIGELQMRIGKPKEALATFNIILSIERRLANDSDSFFMQRRLSRAYEKLVDVNKRLNDAGAMLAAAEPCVAIREKLLAADPLNVNVQRDLLIAYDRFGNSYLKSGNSVKALEIYKKELSIAEKLLTADAQSVRAQRDVGTAYLKLCDVADSPNSRLEAAKKALFILEKLAMADPKSAETQLFLAGAYFETGMAQMRMDSAAAAREGLSQALTIFQKLSDSDPTNDDASKRVIMVRKELNALNASK